MKSVQGFSQNRLFCNLDQVSVVMLSAGGGKSLTKLVLAI